jgi:ribosomal protein L28
MASTYSPSLKLELIGNGDQSGTWGTTTNNNLGTLLEQAITGVQNITMVNANYTLTNYNGVTDEARNAVLVVGGTNSAVRQIVIPTGQAKLYIVKNSTSGGYAITIGAATGATISIPNGVTAQVYYDGTDCFSSQTGSAGNFTVNGTLTATTIGGTTITASTQFSGPGTGLTGTASGLSIGGNAATATSATTATNATNLATTNFTITESGGKLLIKYGATTIASIDSSGNIISAANVTAYGTP